MGFKVVRDYISDSKEDSAVGIESTKPHRNFFNMHMNDKDFELFDYLNGKIKVRLRDEEGKIHYHGVVDDEEFSCELFLRWGVSYSGAIALDMHLEDYKRIYGEISYEDLVTQDGKWYHYMG